MVGINIVEKTWKDKNGSRMAETDFGAMTMETERGVAMSSKSEISKKLWKSSHSIQWLILDDITSIIIPIKMAISLSIYRFQTHFGGVYHVQFWLSYPLWTSQWENL